MIYGYDEGIVNEFGLKQMREISISAIPHALRNLAAFLTTAADEACDVRVSPHWHRHAPEELKRDLGCDVVVLKEQQT